jgi:hypothetical protein
MDRHVLASLSNASAQVHNTLYASARSRPLGAKDSWERTPRL